MNPLIVKCSNCQTKNRLPVPPRTDGKYQCQVCKSNLDLARTGLEDEREDERSDKVTEALRIFRSSSRTPRETIGQEFRPPVAQPLTERYPSLAGFIGQDSIKQDLRTRLDAARQNENPLPHLLLCGPDEFGKATLTEALAREMGVQIKTTQSPVIERVGDLAALITNLAEGEILLIKQIETMKEVVLEGLLEAVENLQLSITLRVKGKEQVLKLDLKPFTLVATTSRPSQIDRRLRRWLIAYDFSAYSDPEIARIIRLLGQQLVFTINSEAATLLAGYCNGSPGEARVLVKRIKDYLSHLNTDMVTVDVAREALASFRYLGTESISVDLVEKLNKMSGVEFEEFVAKCFRDRGYVVEITQASGDHGVDLLLKKNNQIIAVQCKRWTAPVGESVIRDFLGSITNAGASFGYIVASSTFTSKAYSFAQNTPIKLIDFDALLELAKAPTAANIDPFA